jgi:hypothetical protein
VDLEESFNIGCGWLGSGYRQAFPFISLAVVGVLRAQPNFLLCDMKFVFGFGCLLVCLVVGFGCRLLFSMLLVGMNMTNFMLIFRC